LAVLPAASSRISLIKPIRILFLPNALLAYFSTQEHVQRLSAIVGNTRKNLLGRSFFFGLALVEVAAGE
jgi:hypothetical protein